MTDIHSRLSSIEARLLRLEQTLLIDAPGQAPAATPAPPPVVPDEPSAPPSPAPKPSPESPASGQPVAATRILGWGGAIALVLAGGHLVRLAIDVGWFTPLRQVGLAVLAGVGLIGAGLWLKRHDRQYAALLPGVGIVILYLAAYGAHVYYLMIPAAAALAAVVVISIASLWLGRLFGSSMYALFAVCGAYATPLILPVLRAGILDLVIYYLAWNLTFAAFSLWEGSRRTYMLAMYLALVGFDVVWRDSGAGHWAFAATHQLLQFLLFAATTAAFSVRHRQPLDDGLAWLHGLAALIFYFLEYALLERYVPDLAPWIALGSAAFVLVLYFGARRFLAGTQAGAALAATYTAMVLFHAGYLESLPEAWTPWVALFLPGALAVSLARYARIPGPAVPFVIVVAGVFSLNYLRVMLDLGMAGTPGDGALPTAYAVALYLGYAVSRRVPALSGFGPVTLFAAHIMAMAAATELDSGIAVSLVWAVLAVACLVVAIAIDDRLLGRSSFLVFIASALKVMLLDLSGSGTLTRIATLVILGVSLYVGGWLYQRLVTRVRPAS